jgi:hypothetical protein
MYPEFPQKTRRQMPVVRAFVQDPANPNSNSINEFSGADKMGRLYDDSVPIKRLARESGAGTKAKDGQNDDPREKVEGLGSASREIGA